MKFILLIFILFFTGMARLASFGQAFAEGRDMPQRSAQDKIVAIVNHEVVTQSEVEELLAVFYMQIANQYSEEQIAYEIEKMKQSALNRLIEDKLILEEARKEKAGISQQTLDERLTQIKAKFKDETEFQQALDEQGITPADFRRKIEEQLMMSGVVELKVRKDISVSPSEITAYYQAYPDEFRSPESAEIDSIVCPSKDKAQEALSLLSAGKSFEEVEKEFSASSSLGIIKRGELAKNIEEIIFNLKEGEVSCIVEAEAGFYIFRLIKKVPEAKLSLAEAEAEIRERLMRQEMDRRFREWMDGLKKNAYILIK